MTKKEIAELKRKDKRIKDLVKDIKNSDKTDKNYQHKIRLLNQYVIDSKIDRIYYKLYKACKGEK